MQRSGGERPTRPPSPPSTCTPLPSLLPLPPPLLLLLQTSSNAPSFLWTCAGTLKPSSSCGSAWNRRPRRCFPRLQRRTRL